MNVASPREFRRTRLPRARGARLVVQRAAAPAFRRGSRPALVVQEAGIGPRRSARSRRGRAAAAAGVVAGQHRTVRGGRRAPWTKTPPDRADPSLPARFEKVNADQHGAPRPGRPAAARIRPPQRGLGVRPGAREPLIPPGLYGCLELSRGRGDRPGYSVLPTAGR